ncbi:hypothetical protein SAMN02745146_0913 [Hymenobacter daecheongensis DSM 21074]|uniref:Uncharacterized protein n=1 Tax=Hymenobacter daecheongensis DSM 21074 TaxID=1121955 RepID=A0A1M6B8I4_9BACT|nr:hypothetical protein [Hymenobacter daecheongensis]SHI45032.1 hypothetical protein SAMN02745146_0913 [Hymenobacter daecheongensis DSM 21074]
MRQLLKQFWAPGMGRTVLFSVAVVTFVIGVYQTLVENNPQKPLESLQRNYFVFMISLACTMYYRYLKQRENEAAAKAQAARKPPGKTVKIPAHPKRRN